MLKEMAMAGIVATLVAGCDRVNEISSTGLIDCEGGLKSTNTTMVIQPEMNILIGDRTMTSLGSGDIEVNPNSSQNYILREGSKVEFSTATDGLGDADTDYKVSGKDVGGATEFQVELSCIEDNTK